MGREAKNGTGAQALTGEDLRTSLKRLSKGPMKFAFGFKSRQEPILLLHKTKSPQMLRNELKTKLGAKTATHGTASADGKSLVLEVEGTPIPGMGKMVKELLRKEKAGKYTEAHVRECAVALPDMVAGPAHEALHALRIEIQTQDGEIGVILRAIAAGDAADTGTLSAYVKLCARFARDARGCEDAELAAFAKGCAGRAKKLAGLLQRGPGANGSPAGAAPAAPPAAAPPKPAANLSGSVGKGGANRAPDVTLVQELLNGHGASLAVDGVSGPATVKAIALFQKQNLGFLDGRVDPGGKTWAALNGAAPAGTGNGRPGGVPGGPGGPGSPGGPGASGAPGSGQQPSAGAGGAGAATAEAQHAASQRPATATQAQPGKPEVPDGSGIEVGWGDDAIGIKKSPDGTTIAIKTDRDLPLFASNFNVWVIPCYTKGGLKASLEGAVTIGDKTGGALTATGAGTLELGIGRTTEAFTAGPYGSIQLSASHSASVSYSEKDGLDVQPFTFAIKGSGKVGVKVEVADGPKVDVEQQVFDWELFVVHVGRYANDKFEFVQVKAGKDMMRLIAALEAGGPKIEAFVEQYAPDFVKEAAVDAAEWTAESDTAGDIADEVQKGIDYVEEKTGVDVGAGIEELVQSLVDENGETAAEATERVNEEMKKFDASQADFHAVIEASGLKGELRPFRTSQEYNAIVDVWQAETELIVKGKPAPGKWRGMVEELVATARKRKTQQKAAQQAAKKEEDQAVQAAVAAMEGARPAAQGPGNVLNNKLQKSPNAEAQKHFQQGWQHWNAAEQARKQVGGLQGPAKAQKASEAKALYEQARATWQTGLQYLS